MKIHHINKKTTMLLNLVFFALGILAFCYFPAVLLSLFHGFWVAIVIAIFFILTPFGNTRFSDKKKLSGVQWIACIVFLEVALLCIYANMTFLNNAFFSERNVTNTHLLFTSLKTMLLSYGLFPWAMYAAIAVGMGKLAYQKNTDAYFHQLLKIKKNRSIIADIINVTARRCTLFAFSILLLFMTLTFMSFFQQDLHVGFHASTLIITLALLLMLNVERVKKYNEKLFSRSIATAFSFPLFCLLLAIIILILNMMSMSIYKKIIDPAVPSFIQYWINYDSTTAWSLFTAMWWICLTPLVCNFILHVSTGYRLRDIILAVLALPILISLCFIYPHAISIVSFTLSSTTIKLLSLISFFIVLPVFINHTNSSNAIFSYFPHQGIIKPRDHIPFFNHLMQLTLFNFYFYLVIGINGIGLFIVSLNYLFAVILLLGMMLLITDH